MEPINVNLEIIRGCENRECMCWNTTCIHDEPMAEMPMHILEQTLRELECIGIDNIALYGRGESLFHVKLNFVVEMARKYLGVPIHLNTDAHMMVKGIDIPPVDFFNICHKGDILMSPFSNFSAPKKVTHIFITRKITNSLLSTIDEYIDRTIKLHPKQHYMIGSIWDCEFGTSPKKGTFKPIPVEGGIDIQLCNPKKLAKKKMYVDVHGTIRKCMFSETVYSSISSLINNYDKTECANCGMGAYKYLIDINE